METLSKSTSAGELHGSYQPRYAVVAEAFERNFTEHNEAGASLCITHDGEIVVDLWGGVKDLKQQTPWQEDTVSVVFSSTKGAVALAAHTLISAGELDPNALVKHYWPEFAVNGKAAVTVKMMLDHSAGVPCFRKTLKPGGCCDWDYMVNQIEQEAPFWEPGTRNGYHMMNFGWTVGELIRRVSGQSLGRYFNSAIAEPTGAEFWIGLPERHEPQVASMVPYRPDKNAQKSAFTRALIEDHNSIPALALFNQAGFNPSKRECRAAEIGGGGGVGNGRGLAKIYAPFACGGELNGRTYVDADTHAAMSEVSMATHEDATLLIPTRFGLGFMKSMDNRRELAVGRDSAILGASAFGHVGAGGSIGFADPGARMSLGYTMNRMGPGILLNERGQSLVDAAYQALGYQSNKSGVWR